MDTSESVEVRDHSSLMFKGKSRLTRPLKKSKSSFFKQLAAAFRGKNQTIEQNEQRGVSRARRVRIGRKSLPITYPPNTDQSSTTPGGFIVSNITQPLHPRATPLIPRNESVHFLNTPRVDMSEDKVHTTLNDAATLDSFDHAEEASIITKMNQPKKYQSLPHHELQGYQVGDATSDGNEIQKKSSVETAPSGVRYYQLHDKAMSVSSSIFGDTSKLRCNTSITEDNLQSLIASQDTISTNRQLRPAPLDLSHLSHGASVEEVPYSQSTPTSSFKTAQEETCFAKLGDEELSFNNPDLDGDILNTPVESEPVDEESPKENGSTGQRGHMYAPTVSSFYSFGSEDCQEKLEEERQSNAIGDVSSQQDLTDHESECSQPDAFHFEAALALLNGSSLASRNQQTPILHEEIRPLVPLSLQSEPSQNAAELPFPRWLEHCLAEHAKAHKFEMMYVVKIKDLQSKHDIKLVIAHNLDKKFAPNINIHLQVLRQRVPYVHETERDHSSQNRFKYGIIMVIAADPGIIANRNNGYILGAFRITNTSSAAEDIAHLKTFVQQIKPRFQALISPSDMVNLGSHTIHPAGGYSTSNMGFSSPVPGQFHTPNSFKDGLGPSEYNGGSVSGSYTDRSNLVHPATPTPRGHLFLSSSEIRLNRFERRVSTRKQDLQASAPNKK